MPEFDVVITGAGLGDFFAALSLGGRDLRYAFLKRTIPRRMFTKLYQGWQCL
jgi:ribulose 1,5-bisphosphate synthetase/thiazole synthase